MSLTLRSRIPLLTLSLCVSIFAPSPHAQTAQPAPLTTDAVAPNRFIAAHGRQALISGYASGPLEVWAYPFEILNDYQVSFRPVGTTTPIDGSTLLRRVTYTSDSITRLYLGPDFIVRETLFVPLHEPGAIITYALQSAHPVAIDIHANPVLNLMWPAAIGGQSTAWNPSLNAFILSTPSIGYTAVIGSPDIVAHDPLGNRTTQGPNGTPLGFTLQPSSSNTASVYVALNPPNSADLGTLFQRLITRRASFQEQSAQHLAELQQTLIQVTTPDEQVNQDLAWSELALDQAWVCNPDLGCGYVAGYGPSRGARRPQYDWFFAGDGLTAAKAAATSGNAAQARDELAFILRYQDKHSGMIWHELSQSAGQLDWAWKYPYMFVHVDITFQFLNTLARYVTLTGDTQFLRDHWPAIAAAYTYCASLIDPATNLPRIPSTKEGGDEQDRLSDDLGLSTSWVEASSAFQQLATLTGHTAEAATASAANQRARASLPHRYWDAQSSFWISGHVASGQPVPERRSGPGEALTLHLFTPQQTNLVLDQPASAAFQTDWGTRGVAAGSAGFDPTSYAKGSVSALGTAELANTFWSAHRSTEAYALWSSILPWFTLDSLGHLHEVLAGNAYQPQEESVPEQTWSSAGFVDATIHGLLGLHVDNLAHTITFSPRIPSTWHDISIANIALSSTRISLNLHQTSTDLQLHIDNPGPPFHLILTPTLPLGTTVIEAQLNHRKIPTPQTQNLPDTVATLDLQIQHGSNDISLALTGGLSILPTNQTPLLGDPSHALHLIDARLTANTLTLNADLPTNQPSTLDIASPWTLIPSTLNATAHLIAPNLTRITFQTPTTQRIESTFQLKR
jgi:glycogen debranching enzyme